MIEDALARGFETLVLTNAMQPMRRPESSPAFSTSAGASARG